MRAVNEFQREVSPLPYGDNRFHGAGNGRE
jgi:hypothetical protein